ncbi:MAG: AAA family ATPase [Chitinophagaceae bacterium]|nr:AAA family ATPase [Chitinophagaceae bacterium]
MYFIFKHIHKYLNNAAYLWDGEESEIQFWGPIQKINILVGSNNSGKSRLLRGILRSDEFLTISSLKIEDIQKQILKNCDLISGENPRFSYQVGVLDPKYYESNSINSSHKWLLQQYPGTHIQFDSRYFNSLKTEFEKFVNNIHVKNENWQDPFKKVYNELLLSIELCKNPDSEQVRRSLSKSLINSIGHYKFSEIHLKYIENTIEYLGQLINVEILSPTPPSRIYIPTLRSAISLYDKDINESPTSIKIRKNIFAASIMQNYGIEAKELEKKGIDIQTGLNFYQAVKKARNNIKEVRNKFEKYEAFLGKTFFGTETVDIIASETNNENEEHLNIWIKGEDRNLHDLGDGVQSLMILLYPIYMVEPNSWIFIEEPEMNLHPGMQRLFLQQLINDPYINSKNLKFFLTTHSNHLLDLTLELTNGISIFTIEKLYGAEKNVFSIKAVKNNDTDILNKLGVLNSSVFLANKSIWVEGITDRIIIKAFLKAYMHSQDLIKLNEDIDYAFFEYSGSNVMHFLFTDSHSRIETDFKLSEKIKAQFLHNKIILIADRDSGKEKKHLVFKDQETKNFMYKYLSVSEIENLMSVDQLKRNLPLLTNRIVKEKISAVAFSEHEYKHVKLGQLFTLNKFRNAIPHSLFEKSGTLKPHYKLKFARILSQSMAWNEMSNSAKKLTKEIYDFLIS